MSRNLVERKSTTWHVGEHGSFHAPLGALAILAAAFFALPYLLPSMSLAASEGQAIETTPSVPLELPRVSPSSRLPTAPRALQGWGAVNPPMVAPARQIAEHRSAEPGMAKAASTVLSTGKFWVQVGAFKASENAARLAARLNAEFYTAVIRRGGSLTTPYVVWVGQYASRERAEEIRTALERRGFPGFILRRDRP